MNRYQEYGHQQLACHQMSDYLESVSEPFPKLETQSKSLRQLWEKFRKPVHYGERVANLWLVKLTLCNSLFSFLVLLPFAVITG
jgi:hypothetical protein